MPSRATGAGFLLESLPDHVVAAMQNRDRWTAGLSRSPGGLEFLVADLQSWVPGQRLRVAFRGGSAQLHRDIVDACREITDAANLELDFGPGPACRSWSSADREHAADIRVGFDLPGCFSLVGTDSINPRIGLTGEPVGGGPHQTSLNLGGFDTARPTRWRGTVRHEFLHALAFHHEHQNMRGPCEAAFRWDDEPGYQPTLDAHGGYVADLSGRRPGIYTYLAGYPNSWSRERVDANLRTAALGGNLAAGPFDAASVMLYRFPALFYRTSPSPCAPIGDGQSLSEGDRRGLAVLYPRARPEVTALVERRENLAGALAAGALAAGDGTESLHDRGGTVAQQTAALMRDVLRRRAQDLA